MLRRLYRIATYTLAALLIGMGVAQAVGTSPGKLPTPLPSVHAAQDHSQHDHTQAMHNQQSKRDCLKFCLENGANDYLSSARAETPAPEFLVLYPAQTVSLDFITKKHPAFATGTARGPPGYPTMHPGPGLRALLLLNARLRI